MSVTTTAPAEAPAASPARTAGGGRGARALLGWGPKVAFVAAVLLLWEFATRGETGSIPSPSEIGPALVQLFTDGEVWEPLGHTLQGWALGMLISTALGMTLGLLIGAFSPLERATRFLVDFLRTIPSLALLPLAVLMYGTAVEATLVIVVFACTWPILLQMAHGVQSVDPVTKETCRSYRITPLHRLLFLTIPGAAGYLATGIRIAAAVSLLLTLSVELLIPAPGIGAAISFAQLAGNLPTMYAWIFIAGVIGVAINAIFISIERRLLRWSPAYRKGSR